MVAISRSGLISELCPSYDRLLTNATVESAHDYSSDMGSASKDDAGKQAILLQKAQLSLG